MQSFSICDHSVLLELIRKERGLDFETVDFFELWLRGLRVSVAIFSFECPGVYGKGAYPGYAGDLLVDSTTGASYNAHGVNGSKYVLPALFDPSTSTCSTLIWEGIALVHESTMELWERLFFDLIILSFKYNEIKF